MIKILLIYTLYCIWVVCNISDLVLNIAACVTVFTMFLLVWVGLRGCHKPVPKNTCPKCRAPLHPIRSQFIKMCGSCNYQEPWELKPGQKPLVTNNRQKG